MRGDLVVANVILPADAEDLPLTFHVEGLYSVLTSAARRATVSDYKYSFLPFVRIDNILVFI